ncbi:leukotriene C4 synthase-like isoform X1 [Vidua macroura]|nr:leukotriene C4 synthase-like isoform X1 [Vidua chalybeata]XP_053847032.1 leukotriene C4 synthase-like isoform X1 [Vidua macroura]
MRDQIDLLATVTVLGVLEQAYFAMQVIYARRKYKISPPETTGHPEFERTFRAQANCSEYFPIFISLLWVAGIFFHQGVTAACGLLYLYTRLRYFQGYAVAAQGRGASHVAPSEREYFLGSAFPAEGRWMLALLWSSEIISLLESKCFPAPAPAEELHCWAL